MVSKDNLQNVERVAQPLTLPTLAGLALALILPAFVIAPLVYPGYIQTHSGYLPLWNVVDLRANLGNLTWTPHILTTFDPLRGNGLLAYYLAALLPLNSVASIKFVMAASLVLGSVGMFLWLRSWLGNTGALVAALIYVYLPHQIVTIYVRGAWGEVLFWGLLPWAILAATYLVTSPNFKLMPIAAIFWLALGLTQLGLTLWALVFLLTLMLVVHRPQAMLPVASALLGAIAAVIIYLMLPPRNIFESTAIVFSDHFLFPFQLVSAQWGFGPSRPGWNDNLSLQLGLVAVGLSLLALFLWQRKSSMWATPGLEKSPPSILPSVAKGREALSSSPQRGELERDNQLIQISHTDPRLLFFFGAVIVLTLLQFGISSVLWNMPLLAGYALSASLTYPWQLIGLIGLCLSVLGGAALWLDRQLTQLPLLGAIVVIIILSVYPYLLPQFVQLDSNSIQRPQAELGQGQLALLAHDFSVMTFDQTVGLERGQTDIPLDVHGPTEPGDTLLLNVAWQPLQTFGNNLKVFVHLVDANGNVIAQFDGQPLEGAHPTSQWIPGETIRDTYPIVLPTDAPPGPYRVHLGFYDEATFERLPVPGDSEGRVIFNVQ